MLDLPMDEKGRNLFITKLFREPLALMKARVDEISSGKPSKESLRYLLHSANDF
jgi:hypothetical protein